MFSLIQGIGAKTIRGSNHSPDHIGFLHTEHFYGASALVCWRLNEYGVYMTDCAFKRVRETEKQRETKRNV